MESKLLSLALKQGTDKCGPEHNYIPFYESTLPALPKKILEIGCFKGQSLRMWREYFPDAELHTLDLFIEHEPPTDIAGLIAHKGHQADYYLLEELRRKNFDLIIDDGSHNSRDQMMSFFGLFTTGMHYYIEDIHCAEEEFYRQGLPFNLTPLPMLNPLSIDSLGYVDCQSPIMLIK